MYLLRIRTFSFIKILMIFSYITIHFSYITILLLRESVLRQVDKKSRVPKEEKGVWGARGGDRHLEFSRRRKGQTF